MVDTLNHRVIQKYNILTMEGHGSSGGNIKSDREKGIVASCATRKPTPQALDKKTHPDKAKERRLSPPLPYEQTHLNLEMLFHKPFKY